MEKKNLLFVIPSLTAGGGEKSLVNLLFQIDYSKYNVDLCLFSQKGIFTDSLPDQVNILDLTQDYKTFSKHIVSSIYSFLISKQFDLALSRVMYTFKNRMVKNKAVSEQLNWKYLSKVFSCLDKEYDAAVGYLEKSSIYFVVDKVNSKKKIGWIHTNYSDSGMDKFLDEPYFKKLNYVVTVSEQCAHSLNENFITLKDRIRIIYNIVSPKIINQLSKMNTLEENLFEEDYIHIITLARLSKEKGIDLAIGACNLLIAKGFKIKWYVLGDGKQRGELQKMIEENGINAHFKLLGVKENPYPYLRRADIYVQPSRYEGKSIAIDEAKILCKPIVVTNYETAKDQIKHGEDGMIVDINEKGICSGIENLMDNTELRNKLILNLSRQKIGTEEEVNKLYGIINE